MLDCSGNEQLLERFSREAETCIAMGKRKISSIMGYGFRNFV